jgi:hypothetical protein
MAARGNVMSNDQRFRSAIAVTILTVLTKSIIGQEGRRPVVEAHVFDQAEMSSKVLSHAKESISQLFRETGVDVIWVDTPPGTATPRFSVQIILRRKGPTPALGTTVGGSHDRGGTAFVYKDRVLDAAHEREQDVAEILAYAIGHEMGHLLLAHPAHSAAGAMRATWDGDDFRHIATRSLRFTPEQAMAIRAKLNDPTSCYRLIRWAEPQHVGGDVAVARAFDLFASIGVDMQSAPIDVIHRSALVGNPLDTEATVTKEQYAEVPESRTAGAVVCGRATAGDATTGPVAHLRSTNATILALLKEGTDRSATFCALNDAINQAAGIVYVEFGYCAFGHLNGCLLRFIETSGGLRYLRILVTPDNNRQNHNQLLALIAHEMRHALEVLEHKDVVDILTMEAMYRKIGTPLSGSNMGYETSAARAAGDAVLSELATK